jgi:hypothetical protein
MGGGCWRQGISHEFKTKVAEMEASHLAQMQARTAEHAEMKGKWQETLRVANQAQARVRELENDIGEAALAMSLERKAYGAKMRQMKTALADMAKLSREWRADANEQDARIRQRDEEMMAMAKHFESLQVRACTSLGGARRNSR